MIGLGRFAFRYRNYLGPGIFLVALALSRPQHPFGRQSLNIVFDVAGIVIALAGQALRIATIGYEYIVRGGKDGQAYADNLVQGGMFALCRNPMYLGNLLIAIGLALMIHAEAFYLIVIPSIVLGYSAIVAAEEAYLRGKFGVQYEDYCRSVNRWWPRPSAFRRAVAGMRFNWRRVLVKEYSTMFVLIGTFLCLWVWSEYMVLGADALPSGTRAIEEVLAWVSLYLAVRALKKSGYVRD